MRYLRRLAAGVAVAILANIGFATPTHATFPGHNGLIAFGADTGHGSQIYTLRSNDRHLQQLTHVSGDAGSPNWSPDGRHIVFGLAAPDDSKCSVKLMNADGSGVVTLTRDSNVCESGPTFTPNGSRIIFERHDLATNVDAIWSMNLAGGDRHKITAGTGSGVNDAAVSPDGTMLSFIDFDGTDSGAALYVCRLQGDHLRRLTPFTSDVAIKQEWAPDGGHIVFSYDAYFQLPGRSANIATIRPDGSGLHSLTHYTGGRLNAFVGSYSPDGHWIVFRLEDQGRYALYRMNPAGGALHVILPRSSFRPRGIDWGPVKGH